MWTPEMHEDVLRKQQSEVNSYVNYLEFMSEQRWNFEKWKEMNKK